jgi:hypothetical protein
MYAYVEVVVGIYKSVGIYIDMPRVAVGIYDYHITLAFTEA